MPDWAQLKHAYGQASDVPGLLAAMSPDPKAEVWDALWSRLCHQGTVYSASFAALPVLLSTATAWSPRDRPMIVALAAGIVSGETVAGEREGHRSEYQSMLRSWEALAREALRAPELTDTEFIYIAQAVLAFGRNVLWGEHLDRLADGEFEGQCPSCGNDLHLVIGQYGFFATAEEWVKRPNTRRLPIEPASALSGVAEWLHAEACQASRQVVATWVQHLFGHTTCPACGSRLSVEKAIEEGAAA